MKYQANTTLYVLAALLAVGPVRAADQNSEIDQLKAANFNIVLLDAWFQGFVAYPGSRIAPQWPAFNGEDTLGFLIDEAHKRGIRVLVDMVLNHASSEHPYFQQALRDTTSPYRAWFRFSPVKPGQP